MSANQKWFFIVMMGLVLAASDRAGAYVRRVVEVRTEQAAPGTESSVSIAQAR